MAGALVADVEQLGYARVGGVDLAIGLGSGAVIPQDNDKSISFIPELFGGGIFVTVSNHIRLFY